MVTMTEVKWLPVPAPAGMASAEAPADAPRLPASVVMGSGARTGPRGGSLSLTDHPRLDKA
jgi:hypothetical protein